MTPAEFTRESLANIGGPESAQLHSAKVAEVLRELFNLLEEYAPVWYTEEHRDRAVAVLRDFEES